jgi:hypothetical protein
MSTRKRGRPESAICGTISGYQAHSRRKEIICDNCKKAMSDYVKNRTDPISELIKNHKINAGCADCGYNKHPHALDFDHLDNKKFSIATSLSRKVETILEEIEKCEVVCANCHRIRTATRRLKLATDSSIL